ncbi:MAG: cell division/cell wall cluster transcriptional repressor MraZ [Treponema sp.]|nr:MAG: cell division/cell wall cluster transcriptional repressor MraZ [Treponema sp.]
MANDVLTGEYRNNLDEKGRLTFPAKFRADFATDGFVVTRGLEKCLWIFPMGAWKQLSDKVMESASLFQAKSRSVMRRLIAPAQEVDIDKSGRISIPQSLREYAHLEKECVVLGINRYIEIWNAKEYELYLEGSEADFLSAAEELGNICF